MTLDADAMLELVEHRLARVDAERSALLHLQESLHLLRALDPPGPGRSDSEAPRARASSAPVGKPAPVSQPGRGERRPNEALGPGSATTRVRASTPPAMAGPFPCSEPGCERVFTKPQGLSHHRTVKHPVDDSRPAPPANGVPQPTTYLCERCPKSFGSIDELIAHRTSHANAPAPAGIRQQAADRFVGE